jgi:phage terminase large subunit-like protein
MSIHMHEGYGSTKCGRHELDGNTITTELLNSVTCKECLHAMIAEVQDRLDKLNNTK